MKTKGTAVTCDGRLFHRRAAATENVLSLGTAWLDHSIQMRGVRKREKKVRKDVN